MTDYALQVMTWDGAALAWLDDISSLHYTLALNDVGALVVAFDPTAVDPSLFTLDARLALWRTPPGGPMYLVGERVWFVRKWRDASDDNGDLMEVTAEGANYLLSGRTVAYAAGSAQAEKTMAADDMLKAIVTENLGASAGVSLQRRIDAYLTVAANLTLAPAITKAFSRRNMLEVLKDIADQSAQAGHPLYFDVVSPTGTTLEFRTYYTIRGVDRSLSSLNPLIVSRENGSLGSVELVIDHTEEVNFAYAGGQGEGAARVIQEASDTVRIGGSGFNRRETFRDARDDSVVANVLAEAVAEVRAGRPRKIFSAELVSAPGAVFGTDWDFGYRITAQHRGVSYTCDVKAVDVSMANGEESISAKLQAEESV